MLTTKIRVYRLCQPQGNLNLLYLELGPSTHQWPLFICQSMTELYTVMLLWLPDLQPCIDTMQTPVSCQDTPFFKAHSLPNIFLSAVMCSGRLPWVLYIIIMELSR